MSNCPAFLAGFASAVAFYCILRWIKAVREDWQRLAMEQAKRELMTAQWEAEKVKP